MALAGCSPLELGSCALAQLCGNMRVVWCVCGLPAGVGSVELLGCRARPADGRTGGAWAAAVVVRPGRCMSRA